MMNAALTRREWLSGAAATGLIGNAPAFAASEPPPETTRIRVADSTVLRFAPQFVAEDLLRAEGFTQIEFTQRTPQVNTAALFGPGEADIGLALTPSVMLEIDAGQPLLLLLLRAVRAASNPRGEGPQRQVDFDSSA